jgi:two-component system OmpR family sensor kinase
VRARSLRARLTIWYAFAMMVMLCLAGVEVLWQHGRLGIRRVDRETESLVTTVISLLQDELHEDPDVVSAAEEVIQTVSVPGRALAILNDRGQAIAARWESLTLPDLSSVRPDGPAWSVASASGDWRVFARSRQFDEATLVVLVASPLTEVRREGREIQEAMLIGIPLAIGLAAIGGLWLASVGLRPITEMAHRAASIPLSGMQDLGESTRDDELGQLATAFNGLVARLRAALATQRQFMADASHELRTPVSVIRSAADVILSRGHRDEVEYREALTIVRGEARRVSRLVEDMLVLGRADAGGYPLQPGRLYLDELVYYCRRSVEMLAAERAVAVECLSPSDIPFVGDEDLLRRMLVNLVQNAVQHSPDQGTVQIRVRADDRAIEIRVTDHGCGIPPADQQRIFDRFVQVDPSRRASGAGLGLPIARWIAEAHGGSLDLEASGATGSTFRVVLPARTLGERRPLQTLAPT